MTCHLDLIKRMWLTHCSSLGHPCFDIFGWLSWQYQTNKYEATELQIKQGWIQIKVCISLPAINITVKIKKKG
jgi:hypothetical protein